MSRTAIVILGASGDLAKRKLVPALFALYKKNELPKGTIIVGSGRSAFSDQEFRNRFEVSEDFAQTLFYHQNIIGIKEAIQSHGQFSRTIFFFALPPISYVETARQLSAECLPDSCSIIVEKPFGYNEASSRELNDGLRACFREEQIFRIDHYLAKEAVQNILVFRFANTLFEPLWNNEYIDCIQISGLETLGVGRRAAYFDRSGIIRDMVQNHLTQLLCLLTMDAPLSLGAAEIQKNKCALLERVRVVKCFRYQYEGYCEEPDVNSESTTETFAELQLSIDTPRWSGVPVFLRTGKATGIQSTDIGVRFKMPARQLFQGIALQAQNAIVFKIQPSEGIILDVTSKLPGADHQLVSTNLNFCYRSFFETEIPEAYQKLLLDILHSDHTLFVGAEETELSWRVFDTVLDKKELLRYKPGQLPPTQLPCTWINFDRYQCPI